MNNLDELRKKKGATESALRLRSLPPFKKGATEWTVGKLLTIVLLVVFMALVIYGISSGGINPLIDQVSGKIDSVLVLFNIKDDPAADGVDCIDKGTVTIDGVGQGKFTVCREYCQIMFGEIIGFSNTYGYDYDSGFYYTTNFGKVFPKVSGSNSLLDERGAEKVQEIYFNLTKAYSVCLLGEDKTEEAINLLDVPGSSKFLLAREIMRLKEIKTSYYQREFADNNQFKDCIDKYDFYYEGSLTPLKVDSQRDDNGYVNRSFLYFEGSSESYSIFIAYNLAKKQFELNLQIDGAQVVSQDDLSVTPERFMADQKVAKIKQFLEKRCGRS